MLDNRIVAAAWLVSLLGALAPPLSPAEVWPIQATSRMVIHVGKAGAFGFAGHAHVVEAPVSGTVTVDSADLARSEVALELEAASLRVTGEGESARDVPEVQAVMLSERVLDVKRYPKILFRSRQVTVTGRSGASVNLSIAGDLSLHGVTKPCVVPVKVTLQGGSLTAEGTTTVRQTDFGIEPVTAAGGTIRVKDALDISFTVRAGK